jgi:L-methionine (R)-S-oxide reductase
MDGEWDFDLLARVYLDPLLLKSSIFWAGIYENLKDASVLRIHRGPTPPSSSCEFGKGNIGLVAQSGQRKVTTDVKNDPNYTRLFDQTKSEWAEPILFGKDIMGVLNMEQDKPSAFHDNDAIEFRKMAQQLGALMAWKKAPWLARLESLALLFQLKTENPVFDWIGIYRLNDRKDSLICSAYIGDPTEHIVIPNSEGICGAAIREERTENIPDVQNDRRFLACSPTTRSELVIPIYNDNGEAIAEIDIDSNTPAAFTEDLVDAAEDCAKLIEEIPNLF